MKNRILFFIVVFTIMLGCSKDGEQGPKGDKGDKGEQGDVGAKGADGTKVLSGTTAPAANLGNIGDYYIDLALTNIYGPKTANSWGNPTSLKGAQGENGENGKDGLSLLSGNVAPTMDIGKVGDLYFNLSTLTIHGPKNLDNWGTSYPLASTQNSGVHVILIKNVKFSLPAKEREDYNLTKPNFSYVNNEINLGNVNINKGISFIYWRYNDPILDNGVFYSNYFRYQWNDLVKNGDYVDYGSPSINLKYRIAPFKVGYNSVTKNNFLQVLLEGNEILSSGQPNPVEFNAFLGNANFDILIKYIPESSAVQMQASGRNVQELLRINPR
ncbi:hypothetical protein [Sphingobacterium mizutaii]|uniref:hypothetical protein n=1 Tax=Sphingobacterium mizutaii TaxID=1010 RepID=UPI003D965E26